MTLGKCSGFHLPLFIARFINAIFDECECHKEVIIGLFSIEPQTDPLCTKATETDRYIKIRGRFVNNQIIIGRIYSPPKTAARAFLPFRSDNRKSFASKWSKQMDFMRWQPIAGQSNAWNWKENWCLKRSFCESILPAVPDLSTLSSMSQESMLLLVLLQQPQQQRLLPLLPAFIVSSRMGVCVHARSTAANSVKFKF